MLKQRLQEKMIISNNTKPIEAALPKPQVQESKRVKSFGSQHVVETILKKQMELCTRLDKEQDLGMIDKYLNSIS